MNEGVVMQLAPLAAAPAHRRAHAFEQHHEADDAEEENVGQGNDKVDLADLTQIGEEKDAGRRAGDAAGEQHQAHLEIHTHASPVGEHPGYRGRDDLVSLGSDGDRRGYADENQQRGHQETTTDSEDA